MPVLAIGAVPASRRAALAAETAFYVVGLGKDHGFAFPIEVFACNEFYRRLCEIC